MRASACASPGKADGGTGRPHPQKTKKKQRGEGGGARKKPTATKLPANTTRGGQTPRQKAPKTGPPKRHGGTTQPKPATPSHEQRPTGKRDTETSRHTRPKKKEPAAQPERKGDGGTGTTRPGTGTPSKRKNKKTKAQKNPAKKGWAQRRPGPSTHAHTARQNQKRRGASGAPTQPHRSHKQAETEPQPRTPQTADTRGTTPQTMPKHTHPRPQPGLAGLTKPTPNRKPDPNTNAAQQ